MTLYYCYFDSPIGSLLLACSDKGLTHIKFPHEGKAIQPEPHWLENGGKLKLVVNQLIEYFEGSRKAFDLALDLQGTDFQINVWQELIKIPYGYTKSYGEIASYIGNPKASRAVGMANNKNRIPIVIPCHRVIGSNGSLVGFASGLSVKKQLLNFEFQSRNLLE